MAWVGAVPREYSQSVNLKRDSKNLQILSNNVMGRTFKGTESLTGSVKWNQPIGTKNNSFFQHILLTVLI